MLGTTGPISLGPVARDYDLCFGGAGPRTGSLLVYRPLLMLAANPTRLGWLDT